MSSSPHSPNGLRFLFPDPNGRPFRPTLAWIKPEKGGLESWSLMLSPPKGQEEVAVVDDLKSWMLSGEKNDRETRVLALKPDAKGQHGYRKYHREEVLKRYLREVISNLPKEKQNGPFWLLMPTIADEKLRKRYRAALEEAVPDAYALPEPEMVIEYFRLVRRELALRRDRTGIFLVIDAGAATCNFTFVLTRKDEKVVDSSVGRQRVGRLRAVRGDAALISGRWVDKSILGLFGIDLAQCDPAVRRDLLAIAESAKVQVSVSRNPATIHHPVLSPEPELNIGHLEGLAKELWKELAKVYLGVAKRFLEQLQDTQYAQEQFGPLLAEHNVTNEHGVQHLVDAVLLAGGTSQLPGFEQAMKEAVFPDVKDLNILRVGPQYPVAAAVGALAHILHQQYDPRRLRAASDSPSSLATSPFRGTLPTDLFFEWKYKGDGGKLSRVLVLSRDEPFVEEGGIRPIDLPKFEQDEELTVRLVPGVEKSRRKGYKPVPVQVRKEPGRMSLKWNAVTREARISSADVSRVGEIFLNMNQLVNDAPPHDDLSKVQIPQGMLMTAAAPDVVIDVGMSKTVVVTAQRGLVSVQALLDPIRIAPPAPVRAALAQPAPTGAQTAPPHVLSARNLQVAEPPPSNAREAAEALPPAASGGEAPSASQTAPSGGSAQAEDPPSPVVLVESFGVRLERFIGEIGIPGIKQVGTDLTMLLLALAVRPFVLLAGPPGSGKSTLVRIAAKLLNTEATKSYFEIAVQPHWRQGSELPPSASSAYQEQLSAPVRMFLFDEFNLARPEHYLMPFFQLLDAFAKQPSRGRMLACGTLNIDDTSRPPSPKIIDRCFMIEIDAAARGPQPDLSMLLSEIDALPVFSLPIVSRLVDGQNPRLWGPVGKVIEVIHETVDKRNLRQDLLPSRRVLNDIAALLQLHDEAGIPKSLLPEDELVDRALAGRMLVKLSGAAEQVEPLVDALEQHFKASPYKRCHRRIALARAQLQQLGFVSPWQ